MVFKAFHDSVIHEEGSLRSLHGHNEKVSVKISVPALAGSLW
jgi:6-pyruvoyl-tetrahydropterin synthase